MEFKDCINTELINSVLSEYGMPSCEEYEIKLCVERNGGARSVVVCRLPDGRQVVIKLVNDPEVINADIIIKQKILIDCLRNNGIATPRRYCYGDGQSFAQRRIAEYDCYVTVEEYIAGTELPREEFLQHLEQLATLQAAMHSAALNEGILFGRGSAINLFGDVSAPFGSHDETLQNYNRLVNTEGIERLNPELLQEYKALFERSGKNVRDSWREMPRAAVQGDFSPNNFLFVDGVMHGVIDYHLAGDEVLLNDLVFNAVFLSGLGDCTAGILLQRIEKYIKAYCSVRPLTRVEEEAMPGLVNLWLLGNWPFVAETRGHIMDNDIAAAEKEIKGAISALL